MACLDESELKTLKPDALSPAEIEAKAESIAVAKAGMKPAKVFVLAMLAGAFISFGALYFCVFLGDPSIPFAVQRVVGGLCFCLGLVLVLCCGAELFTGNSPHGCRPGQQEDIGFRHAEELGDCLGGQSCGRLGDGIPCVYGSCCRYERWRCGCNHGFGGRFEVTPDWITLFFKGILCNIFVCLAVRIGFGARTVVDKVIGILLPISAFVACGFEHCVANMFFLPMGLLAKTSGFAAVIDASALDLGSIFYNICCRYARQHRRRRGVCRIGVLVRV